MRNVNHTSGKPDVWVGLNDDQNEKKMTECNAGMASDRRGWSDKLVLGLVIEADNQYRDAFPEPDLGSDSDSKLPWKH